MKKIILLILAVIFFAQCSNEPAALKPDVEYNIDGVRVVIPRKFEKVSSEDELKKIYSRKDSLSYLDKNLLAKEFSLTQPNTHLFIKDDGRHLNYLVLKTDGPNTRLTSENQEYLQTTFENLLENIFEKKDSTSYVRNMESKMSAANRVKYFKLKYFIHENGNDWYTTSYLIYSNNRTIGMTIFTPHKDHLDLEKHMNFIRIENL